MVFAPFSRHGAARQLGLVSLFSPRVAGVGAVRRSWDWRRPFRHVCVPARAGVVLDTRPWAKIRLDENLICLCSLRCARRPAHAHRRVTTLTNRAGCAAHWPRRAARSVLSAQQKEIDSTCPVRPLAPRPQADLRENKPRRQRGITPRRQKIQGGRRGRGRGVAPCAEDGPYQNATTG